MISIAGATLVVIAGLLLSGLLSGDGAGTAGSPSPIATETPNVTPRGTAASPSPSPSPSPPAVVRAPRLEWQQLPSPEEGASVFGVEYLAGTWYALGRTADRHPMIWTSVDLATWRPTEVQSTAAVDEVAVPLDIAAAGDSIVVSGQWGIEGTDQVSWAMWRSTDGGRTWQESRDDGHALQVLIAGGPGYIGAGWEYRGLSPPDRSWVASSADGEEWIRVDDEELSSAIYALARHGDRLIAAGFRHVGLEYGGANYAAVWVSDDGGASWEIVAPGQPPFDEPDTYIADLAVGPAGLVAVGKVGRAAASWVSPDGLSWSRIGMEGGEVEAIATLGGLVAVGSAGECGSPLGSVPNVVWVSADGSGWDLPTTLQGEPLCVTDAAASDAVILAVGPCGIQECTVSFLRGDLVGD